MFIGQRVSVFGCVYLHLGEGFFAEVGWSKNCCQTKSYISTKAGNIFL